MRKGALNFLGRKNQSLFDTNIKFKDMDNMELVLGPAAVTESGTASVRARPTVKHHTSSSFDSFQGFAVPTPKVPVLPPANGPKINGSVSGDSLSNGSVISVPDLVEGEIFVPPPPSMAPPPPPGNYIPPPSDFMDDLENLQPPSMPAPKLPSLAPSMGQEDLSSLKPPPMAPPKPPSTCSSGSASSFASTPPAEVPEHPKFAAPQPPSERQQKTFKTPPPKPIRLSSISALDSPPQTPAPPPPVQTPTLSTFNPQNTAKLYNIPRPSILSGYDDPDSRPKQMLVLEDSGSVKSAPVVVQADGKVPKVAPPSKPVPKNAQELKENVPITQPSPSPPSQPKKEPITGSVSAPLEINKPLRTPHQKSTQLQKVNSPEPSKDKPEVSPGQGRKFSPILDRKLRSLKSSETNGAREGPVASPLALLMAAKERDKLRSTKSLSRENSGKTKEPTCSSIQPSESSPNSFIVTPRPSSSSSLKSQDKIQESPKSAPPVVQTQKNLTPQKTSSPAAVKDTMPFTIPAVNGRAASPSVTNQDVLKENANQSSSRSQSPQLKDNNEEISMPLLPPPPEFDDFDGITEPPPSIPPPDPPMKKAPLPNGNLFPRAQVPPTPLKPSPPPAPKAPPLNTEVKPKPQVQTKPKVTTPTQLPSNLSPSQATLLSILQKKMLEMDHKMSQVKEPESNSDDWGSPLSDEDSKVPVVTKSTPPKKTYPAVNKVATLDMRELESKMAKKHQEISSLKVPTSNGVHSKHQYGMTFTVRPGAKQPITLVSKGEA